MECSGIVSAPAIVPFGLMCAVIIACIDLIPKIVIFAADIPMGRLNVCITFLPLPFLVWAQRNGLPDMDRDFAEVIIKIQPRLYPALLPDL